MDLQELQVELTAFLNDSTLLAEHKLQQRAEALDFLTFLQDVLRMERRPTPAIRHLQQQALHLQSQLETVNAHLFEQLCMAIQSGTLRGNALRGYVDQFTDYRLQKSDGVYMSYDGLDVLVDGLFQLKRAPAATIPPTVEMVHCEETPARVLLDLIDHTPLTQTDVFYDLGSGLGQVVMLVHLLTGVKAKGVEVEPVFCAFAQAQATRLGLPEVTFINTDARMADYSDGTLFFMFTPFRGQLLQNVLERLHQVAHHHPIRLCTFGSCTPRVADQSWLRPVTPDARHEYKLAIFESALAG